MKLIITMALMLLFVCGLRAQEIIDGSFETEGYHVLVQSVEVNATPSEVWELMTTNEGIVTWMAPVAEVDFRIGGGFEATYNPAGSIGDPGNIKNEILSYIPERSYVIKISQSPPNFPFKDVQDKAWSEISLEATGGGTTLVTGTGVYPKIEGMDKMRMFFSQGNKQVLTNLYNRVENGPVDWQAFFEKMQQQGGSH